jgi:hypothetical protein
MAALKPCASVLNTTSPISRVPQTGKRGCNVGRDNWGLWKSIKAHRIQRLFPQSWSPPNTLTSYSTALFTALFTSINVCTFPYINFQRYLTCSTLLSSTTMSSKLYTAVVLSLLFSSVVLGMPAGNAAGTSSPAVKDGVCKICPSFTVIREIDRSFDGSHPANQRSQRREAPGPPRLERATKDLRDREAR